VKIGLSEREEHTLRALTQQGVEEDIWAQNEDENGEKYILRSTAICTINQIKKLGTRKGRVPHVEKRNAY